MDTASLLTLQSAQTNVAESAQKNLAAQAAQAGNSQSSAQTSSKNAKLGLDFESMVLSQLMAPMFEGLKSDGPFGGGEGEDAMKSFYVDAMAKQMAKHGGVGISNMMQKELLKLQGAN